MAADVLVKNAWYVVGMSREFSERQLQGQVIAEKPLVMWRTTEGKVVAFDERCCHKRIAVVARTVDRKRSARMRLSRLVLRRDRPMRSGCRRTRKATIPPQARLRPFPVIEQDGLVWIWPGDLAKAESARPPRAFRRSPDPAWETADTGPMLVPANSLLLIENLLDITHFYPLHDGNIGDVENSRIPVKLDEGTRDGKSLCRTIREARGYRQRPFSRIIWATNSSTGIIRISC